MRKTDAFRRAAALMAALSITVSLAAPAFAGTYYIDDGDITITKDTDGKQTVQQNGTTKDDSGEIIITTRDQTPATQESDLEGPVVEDNYQPAQPEDAEEPEGADQPESTEEPEDADRQESAGQQPQPQQAAPAAAAAPAAPAPVNPKGNGVFGNIITVINKCADKALKLTLKDVKIDVSDTGSDETYGLGGIQGKAALSVQGNGNVEIELDGKNELKSGYSRAGLEKNTSTSTGTLTLKDDNKEAGSLTATGGYVGAGIGGQGKKEVDHSLPVIQELYGASNITITGGTVNATGGWYGAGIGGGSHGSGKNITITGGTVNATGGQDGAGIGGSGGYNGNGEAITITGGTVTARGGDGGAGIGGGAEASGQNIKITGGTVNASGWAGAGIGGGINGSGINVTVSGAAQVTATASKSNGYGASATIGSGSGMTWNPDGSYTYTFNNGQEIQADISDLTTGYIHHIIYDPDLKSEDNPDGIVREWWEYGHLQPAPEGPNAPAEESNGVSLGTPVLHVETLEGDPLPFDARQQGSTLRVTSDNLAARLHGTRQALEALQEQGVEQIQFVTTLKTTTLSVEDLLAEGGSWFALEHDGLVSRQLSAAQAESLKCWMH